MLSTCTTPQLGRRSTRGGAGAGPGAVRAAHAATIVAIALATASCESPESGERTSGVPGQRIESVRTTSFVAGEPRPDPVVRNPFAGDPRALAEGRSLYRWYNCAGCHGMQGGGGMGPPFADQEWIYGSEPGNIFQSIVQGRPNGMPAFDLLVDEQVWKIVLHVRELGGLPAAGQEGGAQEPTQHDAVTGPSSSSGGRD